MFQFDIWLKKIDKIIICRMNQWPDAPVMTSPAYKLRLLSDIAEPDSYL